MKIIKKLLVNEKSFQIVSESVVVDLTAPGRAVFVIQGDRINVGDLVSFSLGTDGIATLWFSGYVESCRQMDAKQIRLVVREYGALLSRRWTMSHRFTTARRILADLCGKTGIAFRLGNDSATWADVPIAFFFNIGSGYEILELIGKHLKISDFMWCNQPDGSIFVGSGSELAGAGTTLAIPERFFTNLSGGGTDCPCLPDLRPGRWIRIGNSDSVRIETITLQGEQMRLGFQC